MSSKSRQGRPEKGKAAQAPIPRPAQAPTPKPALLQPLRPMSACGADAGSFDWTYDSAPESIAETSVRSAVLNAVKGTLRMLLVGEDGETWEVMFRRRADGWAGEGHDAQSGWSVVFGDFTIEFDAESASGKGRFVERYEGVQPESGSFEFSTDVEVRGHDSRSGLTPALAGRTPEQASSAVAGTIRASRTVVDPGMLTPSHEGRDAGTTPGTHAPVPPASATKAATRKPSNRPLAADGQPWDQLARSMMPRPVVLHDGWLVGGDPGEVLVRITPDGVAVAEFSVEWQGARSPKVAPRNWKTFELSTKPARVARAIIKARARRLATYRWCPECRNVRPPESMADQICQGCGEDGLVF